jgi:ABC-type multidrug transport system fused ATPase/permease subunit
MVNQVNGINTSRTLKVAGVILMLSFLLDFVILLFPFQPTDKTWQIGLANALVDRGIVPMVGLGLLFSGYWVDATNDGGPSTGFDLRLPSLILASVLGLIFLLIFPLHLSNIHKVSAQDVEKITKEASDKEVAIDNDLNNKLAILSTDQGKAALEQKKTEFRTQINNLLKDEQQYKQALESPQISPVQKEIFKKIKANPQEIDKLIEQQTDFKAQAAEQKRQIRELKESLEKQARDAAWKSGLRVGISSLLLSIGYIIIGWTGLRGMGAKQGGGGGRKVAAR